MCLFPSKSIHFKSESTGKEAAILRHHVIVAQNVVLPGFGRFRSDITAAVKAIRKQRLPSDWTFPEGIC